jgi:ribosomal protein S18 acetylase RimI-like enzyme
MSIHYRDATLGDWEQIDRLFRTGFCDTFAHLYAPEDLDAFLAQFTPEAWQQELADEGFAFRLAEDGSQAAGYVKLGPLHLPVEPQGPAIELRQLYVSKAWHGCGIADELMQWALQTARHRCAGEIYLSVYTDNHRARRFYGRHGFTFVAPYTFMVGNHADEDIILRLEL